MALRGKTSTTWKPRLIDSYSTAATALQVIATNLQNKVCDDNCTGEFEELQRRRSINGISDISEKIEELRRDDMISCKAGGLTSEMTFTCSRCEVALCDTERKEVERFLNGNSKRFWKWAKQVVIINQKNLNYSHHKPIIIKLTFGIKMSEK